MEMTDKKTINKETLNKILIVGDIGTGKTSLVKRIVHNIFSQHYKATIGVDFQLKVHLHEDWTHRFQFWDIAGQERYGNMMRVYSKEASMCIVCCDATRMSTMEAIKKWVSMVRSYDRDIQIPFYIVCTKTDLINDLEDMKSVQQKIDDFAKTFETDNEGFKFAGIYCIGLSEPMEHFETLKQLCDNISIYFESFASNSQPIPCIGGKHLRQPENKQQDKNMLENEKDIPIDKENNDKSFVTKLANSVETLQIWSKILGNLTNRNCVINTSNDSEQRAEEIMQYLKSWGLNVTEEFNNIKVEW